MKTIRFNDNKNIVSKKVRVERERLGISQSELASRLQVMGVMIDQQAVSKIELNLRIVTDYEVLCLAWVLGLSADALLGAGEQVER